MTFITSSILKEMIDVSKSSHSDFELEVALENPSSPPRSSACLKLTPQSILNQFIEDWALIREKDIIYWYEYEWQFIDAPYRFKGLLKPLFQNRPFKLAWYLYQKRLQTSLKGSDLAIDLWMPVYGAHRLDLKGSYRCIGDGQYIERCLRPEIRIRKQGEIVLRLDGEVKIS